MRQKQHAFDRGNFKPREKKQKQETKGQMFFTQKRFFLTSMPFFDKTVKQREKKKKSAKQLKKWKQNSKPHGNNNRYEYQGGARCKKKNSLGESATKKKQVKIFFAYETFKSFFSNKDIFKNFWRKQKRRKIYFRDRHIFFETYHHLLVANLCVYAGGLPVLKDVFGISPSNDVSLLWSQS